MPTINYQDPESGQAMEVEITAQSPELTIGRSPGNDIQINNPSISRTHAKLVVIDTKIKLVDLGSSNGTYVNGVRVEEELLDDGDRVRLGEFPIDFVGGELEAFIDVELEPINADPLTATADESTRQDSFDESLLGENISEDSNSDFPVSVKSTRPNHSPGFEDIFGKAGFGDADLFVPEGKVETFSPVGQDPIFMNEESEVVDDTQMMGGEQLDHEPVRRSLFDSTVGDEARKRANQSAVDAPPWVVPQDESPDNGVDSPTLMQEIEQLRMENKALRSQKDALESENKQLQEQLQESPLPREISLLEQELAQARMALADKGAQLSALQAEIAQRDELLAQKGDQNEEILGLGQDTSSDASDESDKKEMNGDLVSELDAQVHEYRERLDVLQQQYDEQLSILEHTANEKDALMLEVQMLREESARQLDETNQLAQQIEELREADKRKKAIFEELSRDLRTLVQENQQLQKQANDLLNEKTSLEETLAELIQERDRMQDSIVEE